MAAHECNKEQVIGEITATIQFFRQAEVRREGREERMAQAMENMSAQGESLKAIAERVAKTEKDTDNLYGRVRDLEIKPAEESGKIRVGFWNALVAALISLLVGIFIKKG